MTPDTPCCTPYSRGPTPSGRMVLSHSKFCPETPNRAFPRRAEVASWAARDYGQRLAESHNWDRCKVEGCAECRYIEYWLDRDDTA